jgi:hypothetical protein
MQSLEVLWASGLAAALGPYLAQWGIDAELAKSPSGRTEPGIGYGFYAMPKFPPESIRIAFAITVVVVVIVAGVLHLSFMHTAHRVYLMRGRLKSCRPPLRRRRPAH